MDLLSTTVIQEKLLEQFEMLEGKIPELNMCASSLTEAELSQFETQHSILLPETMRTLLLRFEFGNLNVGGVIFGEKGSYLDHLRERNRADNPNPWWGRAEKPAGLFMIGSTSSHIVLANSANDEVSAFLRGSDLCAAAIIADSFEFLVRGAGTVHFGRKSAADRAAFGAEIARSCGKEVSSEFWSELAQGIA